MSVSKGRRSTSENRLANLWADGAIEVLNEAVAEYRLAVTHADEDRDDKMRAKLALASGLRIQYEEGLAGEEEHMEAVALAEDVLTDVEVPSQLHLDALMTLAEVLMRGDRFRSGGEEGNKRSIDISRQLVDAITDVYSTLLVKALAVHALALSRRMDLLGDKDSVSEANLMADRALKVATGSTLAPEVAFAIACVRIVRFQIDRQWEDIMQAIALMQDLVSAVSKSHPRLHLYFSTLGLCFVEQYKSRGEQHAVDRSISAFSEAADRVPRHSPRWHVALGNYAALLHLRWGERSDVEDLERAITIGRKVAKHIIEAPPNEKPLHAEGYIGNLGQFLDDAYSNYGRLELLDEAITILSQNLEVGPEARRTSMLNRLGGLYFTRFMAYRRRSDLEDSISLMRRAISCSVLDRDKCLATYRLAQAVVSMHEESRDVSHLNEVVFLLGIDGNTSSSTDQDLRAISHSLLGETMLRRFSTSGDAEDIIGAIRCQQAALELLRAEHVARPEAYSRLGLAQYQMALKSYDISAADASVAAFNAALSDLPTHHPNRAAHFRYRAESELLLANMMGGLDHEAALQSFREAAFHEESWPTDRYTAATRWAKTTHDSHRLSEAIEAYRMAISLLPKLAWVGLEEQLRMQRLSRLAPDLAQDAAACAIAFGDYELAVELSEAARSVLWNGSQELRADLGRLRDECPALAAELAETSAALEFRPLAGTNGSAEAQKAMAEVERARVHRLASRRAELLTLIRTRPGFERFLVQPTFKELSQVAKGGTVVIINSSTYRCDAIVLRPNRPICLLPLSTLRHDQVMQDAWTLQQCLQLAKDARGMKFLDRKLIELLRRLWTTVGEPVCRLVLEGVKWGDFPRIWWCPTGPMSFLPLHACGPHDGRQRNIFDFFISSYTPTLTALVRTGTREVTMPPSSENASQVLMICEPEVPGRPALPCARDELRIIEGVFESGITALVDSHATIARVEELLPAYDWLHVSTHGTQRYDDPLESSLALYDGPLTLSRLAHVRLPNAAFAFLSACHSAKGTYWGPNESMHLAGGMMFAGYKSVVATMWGIADRDAPEVVRAFYERLSREGRSLKGTDTAEALHVAIRVLRKAGVPVSRWVPFIHLGA